MAGLCEGGNEPSGSLKPIFVIHVTKAELKVDSLTVQLTDNSEMEERERLLEEKNSLDLHVTGIKEECAGDSYDCTLEVKSEDTPVSINSAESLMLAGNEFQSLGRAIVKEDEYEYEEVRWDGIVSIVSWRERVQIMVGRKVSEATRQASNSIDLLVTEIKSEYVDHNYSLVSEMIFEETPVPVEFPLLKTKAKTRNVWKGRKHKASGVLPACGPTEKTGDERCSAQVPAGMESQLPECNCQIEKILKHGFDSQDFSQKKRIIELGRPMSDLKKLRVQTKSCVRKFNLEYYSKVDWLCGCSNLAKLFCWPCLLFNNEKNVWNKTGYSDVNNFYKAMIKHENSQSHITSAIKLASFGISRFDLRLDSEKRVAILQHNEEVKENRDIIKRLIDIVCHLGKRELALCDHDESDNSADRGNYVELVHLLKRYDPILNEHIKHSNGVVCFSNQIQNDLIDSISNVITAEIRKEVHNAPFVAIMVDDTTDIRSQSQLSVVLRYATSDGVIQERFVGFSDVTADQTASALADQVIDYIAQYDFGSKIVAQTYDGAVIMSSEINALQAKVREKFPVTTVLSEILQTKSNNISICIHKLAVAKENIAGKREEFKKVFSETSDEQTTEPQNKRTRLDNEGDVEKCLRKIYFDILDNVINQIDVRFQNLDKLQFLELIKPYHGKEFPEIAFSSLKSVYGEHFDFPRLRVVMDFIKTEPEDEGLTIQISDDVHLEEKKPMSEERKFVDLHMTELSDYVGHTYDVTSEIKVEDTSLCKAEEGNVLDLQVTGLIAKCMDFSNDHKSEIKVEESLIPITSPMRQYGHQEQLSYLDTFKEEFKLNLEARPHDDEDICESIPDLHDTKTVSEYDSSQPKYDLIIQSGENCVTSLNTACGSSTNCSDYGKLSTQDDNNTQSHSHSAESSSRSKTVDNSLKIITQTHATDNRVKCDDCGKSFSSFWNLKIHSRLHTGEKPFKCKVCGKSFVQSSNLRVHARLHMDGMNEKRFKCDICGKFLKRPSSLQAHIRSHTDEKKFQCEICGMAFSRMIILQRHCFRHSGEKPLKCDECGKPFPESSALNKHKRIHKGEKRFKCDICGKCFLESGNLTQHVRLHSGERPFKCNVCGKFFTLSKNLKRHTRLHTGEKSLKCEHCGKCFSQSGGLRRHARLHNGEKLFICEVCGKSFAESGNLRKHARLHTGELKCDDCGKVFSNMKNLVEHSRIHNGEKPFKCEICEMRFSESGHLRRHSLLHTGEKLFECSECGMFFLLMASEEASCIRTLE
ncbi:hypothetical protein ANN_27527 [Periplaneta americana]|uniref:C2H2-type domain-containing protein n=1 Tax=Periplaneta americana TaxID=6978 RepID=A0ABQ8RW46_PERAM|nr:hypothetical protein ANN_27527 [Periplaneta americana]